MPDTLTPEAIAETLGMRPIPIEGGRLSQTWDDEHASAIAFLITADDFSGLHRLPQVEIWSYHAGSPASMLLLMPDGTVQEPVLGLDLAAGQRPQVAVPAGAIMAAEPVGDWSLLGTVVAPQFDEATVEFPTAESMAADYPTAAERIRRLARF